MREIRGGVFQGRFHNLLISKNNTFWAPQISRITFQVVYTIDLWRALRHGGGPVQKTGLAPTKRRSSPTLSRSSPKAAAVQPQSRAPVLTVLHDADFRIIWCVGGLSEVARWMEHLVLSWLIWQVTRSPLPLAMVLVFNNLPRPLCSPFTGLLADRLSRRRILIGAQLLNTVTALAVLTLLILERLQPWQVFVAVSLQGVVKSLEDPSRRTAILDLVGAGRLVNALSLDVLNNTTGKLLGPLIGGVLVETVGFPWTYGCVLAIHVVNLGLMTRLRIPAAQG